MPAWQNRNTGTTGCEREHDLDGNCDEHPTGCPKRRELLQPKVTLVNFTPYPIEMLFVTERLAKSDEPADNPWLFDCAWINMVRRHVHVAASALTLEVTPKQWEQFEQAFPHIQGKRGDMAGLKAYVAEVEDWAWKVAQMGIPVGEQCVFNFRIENVTIAWREQLVREATFNKFWIQTARTQDYGHFYDRGNYNNPFAAMPTKNVKGPLVVDVPGFGRAAFRDLRELFDWAMSVEQAVVQASQKVGARNEDLRELVGMGILHRLTMRCDLRSLMTTVSKRTCYIAQDSWTTIIQQMMAEIAAKVDPLLAKVARPPCLDHKGAFKGCTSEGVALDRYQGKDPLPVCPLWYAEKEKKLQANLAVESRTGCRDVDVEFERPQDPANPTRVMSSPFSRDSLVQIGRWDEKRNRQYAQFWNRPDLIELEEK